MIGLIALYSSYDHFNVFGRVIPLNQQRGDSFILASLAVVLSMLNWRRDPGYEQRMRQLRLENAELDKKLRDFDALELRLKHGKSSSPASPGHPLPTESSSSKL